MALDKTSYHELERRFREQVIKDRENAIERVYEGWGIYLPCREPASQVDYVIVGMEPSFAWAGGIEEGEKKIAEGGRNFDWPDNTTSPLWLFRWSIEKYPCKPGEYHLTDLSKGAMPVTVAALDRNRRYEEWYPFLLEEIAIVLEEIAIVGKPGAPVIAIGKYVEKFLEQKELRKETGRCLHSVPHYSFQASGYIKAEVGKDREGFERFRETELEEERTWPLGLSEARQRLLFLYKKRFEEIRSHTRQTAK